MRVARMAAGAILSMVEALWAGGGAEAAAPAPNSAEVKERVDGLLACLSLEEKIGQLNQAGALALGLGRPKVEDVVRRGGAGPLADSQDATDGAWVVFGHTSNAVTVLRGISAKLPNAKVEHAPGPKIRRDDPSFFDTLRRGPKKTPQTPKQAEAAFRQAVATARTAELVVMVLGENANMAGEAASRASLDLPGRQQELLEAVVALGRPVVLVLLNGRPLSIAWAAEHVPAILEAWEPGSEGGHAVADILFDDVKPGGKLPVTFCVHQKAGSDSRPARQLKGFERVSLQPGEKRRVTFRLGPDELRYWSTSAKAWVQDAEAFDLVGRRRLHGEAERRFHGRPLNGRSTCHAVPLFAACQPSGSASRPSPS